MDLEQIRQKFRSANYAPRKDCKYCDGTGLKRTHPDMPCICIYVDHELCDFAAQSLAETARQLKAELE